MFDRTINVTLPNSLLQLEEGLRRSFPPVGIQKGILDSPCLLILLIYTKHKNNKIKSWTDTLSSFPWVKQTFSKMFEDISWNVWLNSLKCLATLPRMFGHIPWNVWGRSATSLPNTVSFWWLKIGNMLSTTVKSLHTDLSKAFVCLYHDLLIAKLNAYGLSLSALKLVHNYLQKRK